jgi:hypothetical protein
MAEDLSKTRSPKASRPDPRPIDLDYGEQDENGVDLSLIRWFLRLEPLERLRVMERRARGVKVLLEHGREYRQFKPA